MPGLTYSGLTVSGITCYGQLNSNNQMNYQVNIPATQTLIGQPESYVVTEAQLIDRKNNLHNMLNEVSQQLLTINGLKLSISGLGIGIGIIAEK